MPTYYFHLANGRKLLDPRGIEFPDQEAARRHAERLADGLTAVSREFGGIAHLRNWHIRVTDAQGKTLARCGVPEPGKARPRGN
jgi:hypothetical protein